MRAALESSGLDHGPISVHEKMRAMGLASVPSTASLARIFRQAERSLIVRSAHAMNHGQPPITQPGEGDVRDFFFTDLPKTSTGKIQKTVLREQVREQALSALADETRRMLDEEVVAAAGVPVEWDDDFPGMRRCYVADPVGNRVELLEPA